MVKQSADDMLTAEKQRAEERVDEAPPHNRDQHRSPLKNMQVGELIRDEDRLTPKEGPHRGEHCVGRSYAVRFEKEPIRQGYKLKHAEEKDDRFDDLPYIASECGKESVHARGS